MGYVETGDSGTVDYKVLSHKDRLLFNDSRGTEINQMLDLNAYHILSLEESLKFREHFPEYVLPSRWVDRWKPTDEGGVKAKSRIVILVCCSWSVVRLHQLTKLSPPFFRS